MGVLVGGKDQETPSRLGAGLFQTGLTGLVLKAGQMITGGWWGQASKWTWQDSC